MKKKAESSRQLFSVLQRLSTQIVAFSIRITLIFTLVSFGVCIIVFCAKYKNIFSVSEMIWCIPSIILLVVIVKLAKIMQSKKEFVVSVGMIALEILIAAVMIGSYDTQPCADYAPIWQSANKMAQGVFTGGTEPNHYMYYYNWQIGIAVFESLLIRLGVNFFGLKIINALLLIITQHMVYRMVKRKFGFHPACIAYALSTLFMPWCLTIPQFSNHHIGIVFLLLSLYLIERQNAASWICAGGLLAVMNFLRPMGIIVILAAFCYSVYLMIQKRRAAPMLLFIGLLLSYCLVLSLFDHALISAGYTDAKVSQARLPYFKFQKGLYDYREPSSDLKAFNYDYDKYNAAMKEQLIAHITTQPLQTIVFIANKMVRYLGLFDYQFEMTYNHDVEFYTQYPVKALYCISWFQYIGVSILAIIGYKAYIKKYPVDIYQIFFIGNTLVYLFIEAFSSYRFESYPFLLMLASLGVSRSIQHAKALCADQFGKPKA